MNATIYHYDNIMAKKWITTKTRALVYLILQGSVAERIKHDVSSMFTYRRKSSPCKKQVFQFSVKFNVSGLASLSP